ncbi:PIN2/TERF1-interacting telomerase inhibitor 1-like [Anticarsia gemmatalis]|uniref:PIN2/TERF1-interacting telomerase inhibitor 1-like n=1 Tax=Anticarsia gemmatalis TaxID=129554 RepID=UPI003F764DCB
MAMLAAPRRKQKVINLRAKNNAWSNDSNKFGQRMLEKMGWSEGKGLGAHENGIVEHVVARYKNDDKGLGFEDRNDQWTKHEDDFNSLLANLSNGDNNEDKLHSGVSLEVKSKKSKARVHYHKFTRGKDLTRYSEKDLANIFGKKSLKNEEKQEEAPVEDVKTTETVFTDKGSMVDYFKNKLAAFKSKNNVGTNDNTYEDDRADCAFKGFSGAGDDDENAENKGFGFQGFSFYNSEKKKEEKVSEEIENSEKPAKKSKKKKKNKNLDEPQIENLDNVDSNSNEDVANQESSEIVSEDTEKVKKSKKRKNKDMPVEPVEEPVEIKKSKKKNKVIETVEEHATEDYVPKKKKKRKNKDTDNE